MKKFKSSNCFVPVLIITMLFTSCSKTTEPSSFVADPAPPTPPPIVFPVLYAGLPWESNLAGLQIIRPPLPILFYTDSFWLANHVKIELKQDSIAVSDSLPYVYYREMAQDTTPIFYTIDPIYDDLGDKYGPLLIFGRQNANNDFSKKGDVKIYYLK